MWHCPLSLWALLQPPWVPLLRWALWLWEMPHPRDLHQTPQPAFQLLFQKSIFSESRALSAQTPSLSELPFYLTSLVRPYLTPLILTPCGQQVHACRCPLTWELSWKIGPRFMCAQEKNENWRAGSMILTQSKGCWCSCIQGQFGQGDHGHVFIPMIPSWTDWTLSLLPMCFGWAGIRKTKEQEKDKRSKDRREERVQEAWSWAVG